MVSTCLLLTMAVMWFLNICLHFSSVKKASGSPDSPKRPLVSILSVEPLAVELHLTYCKGMEISRTESDIATSQLHCKTSSLYSKDQDCLLTCQIFQMQCRMRTKLQYQADQDVYLLFGVSWTPIVSHSKDEPDSNFRRLIQYVVKRLKCPLAIFT